MVQIIKADGTFAKFEEHKIERTVLKAGGSREFAKEIAKQVEKEIYENISTKEILKITLRLLKEKPSIALKYNLKTAIMSLGPHGFTFEEFFSQILQNYDYKTKVGLNLKGKATTHEVDILAEKENKKYMIEAKYHNLAGTHTNSNVAMYTYARFLDLHNHPNNKINQGWLVTNTKCTPHAIEYANGVGLKITSWQYSSDKGENLQELIKVKKLYPITILNSVTGDIKDKLAKAKVVLVKSLMTCNLEELKNKTDLTEKEINKLLKEAKELYEE
ncbi:MAG: ATP cone domain-containing protein [Candidatus Pacearchaeota archaeon]|jgi:hypothetical protein